MTKLVPPLLLLGLTFTCGPASARAPAPRIDKPLTLRQAVRIGVKRNLGLLLARLERQRQALGIASAKRAYVPKLSLSSEYTNDTPYDRSLSRDQRLSYGAGLSWYSTVGTSVSGGVSVDQSVAGETKQSQSYSTDQHRSSVYLSAKQPLLKGGWRAGARTPLKQAEIDAQIERETYRKELDALIVSIEQAYAQLAFAQDDLRIKTRSRDRARQQRDDTKENIKRGILAKPEIYVVEENLVFFQQQLLKAEESRKLARLALAKLLQLDARSRLSAADGLTARSPGSLARALAIRRALGGNPALRVQQLKAARARVKIAFEKNQALPSLDLSASFKLNGLDSSYADHWAEMVKAKRPELTLGLNFSIPLSWKLNRAEVDRAKIEARRELVRLKQEETRVRFLVGDLLTRVLARKRELALAERRVELNRRKLAAQLDKYKNGISTLVDVVRFQRDLDDAMISAKRVRRTLNNSSSSLLEAQGHLHRAYGIVLDGGS